MRLAYSDNLLYDGAVLPYVFLFACIHRRRVTAISEGDILAMIATHHGNTRQVRGLRTYKPINGGPETDAKHTMTVQL